MEKKGGRKEKKKAAQKKGEQDLMDSLFVKAYM